MKRLAAFARLARFAASSALWLATGSAYTAERPPWQGEWGRWAAENGRLLGASVSIFACDAEGRACRMRLDAESPQTRCAISKEQGVPLEIAASGTSAAAHFEGFDGAPKDCRLELTLGSEGPGAPQLRARLEGAECRYFCTNDVVFPDTLPVASREAYPWLATRECHADARAARRAWCIDPGLQSQDAALEDHTEAVVALTHDGSVTARVKAMREAWLASCEKDADPLPCLHAALSKGVAEMDAERKQAQSRHDQEDQDLAAPGDAAKATALTRDIAGVYKKRFPNALVDGSTFTSEDILEIVPVSDDTLYFRTHLEFYNGHVCDERGLARFSRAGTFFFREADPAAPDMTCRLQLAADPNQIRLLDPDHTCRHYCGARGNFDGAAFPRSARRPIRYMDLLKASSEYKEAVAKLLPR